MTVILKSLCTRLKCLTVKVKKSFIFIDDYNGIMLL